MKIFIALTLVLILASCASIKIYKLTSYEKNIEYDNGTEITNSYKDSSIISIAYSENDEDRLLFYLKITNNSKNIIEFEPHHIYMNELEKVTYKKFIKTGKQYFSVNPELQLKVIENNMEWNKGNQVFLSVLNLASSIVIVASDLSDDENEFQSENIAVDVFDYFNTQSDINYDYEYSRMTMLDKKNFWEERIIRRTTLYPGDSIEGFIFQRTDKNINYFELIIPVGDEKHKIIYGQLFKRV